MHRFDYIKRPATVGKFMENASIVIKGSVKILFPMTVYAAAFIFCLTFPPLARSPLLHIVGGVVSFILNILTFVLSLCIGLVIGVFDYARESLSMFPFAPTQLRVVTGLVFAIGIIFRIFNTLYDNTHIFGQNVFVSIVLGLGMFLGIRWLDIIHNWELSVAEQIFIGIGYPLFNHLQKGKGFSLRSSSVEN